MQPRPCDAPQDPRGGQSPRARARSASNRNGSTCSTPLSSRLSALGAAARASRACLPLSTALLLRTGRTARSTACARPNAGAAGKIVRALRSLPHGGTPEARSAVARTGGPRGLRTRGLRERTGRRVRRRHGTHGSESQSTVLHHASPSMNSALPPVRTGAAPAGRTEICECSDVRLARIPRAAAPSVVAAARCREISSRARAPRTRMPCRHGRLGCNRTFVSSGSLKGVTAGAKLRAAMYLGGLLLERRLDRQRLADIRSAKPLQSMSASTITAASSDTVIWRMISESTKRAHATAYTTAVDALKHRCGAMKLLHVLASCVPADGRLQPGCGNLLSPRVCVPIYRGRATKPARRRTLCLCFDLGQTDRGGTVGHRHLAHDFGINKRRLMRRLIRPRWTL